MSKIKCPNCEKELEIEISIENVRIASENKHPDSLSGRQLWRKSLNYSFGTAIESIILICVFVGLRLSSIKWLLIIFLLMGFFLNFFRAWIKDTLNRRYGRKAREKNSRDLWPTYFMNYPVFVISAYYLLHFFKQVNLVIPFLIGWSIDYLWEEGNIFSGLGKILK